jgi:hypothetical protein
MPVPAGQLLSDLGVHAADCNHDAALPVAGTQR